MTEIKGWRSVAYKSSQIITRVCSYCLNIVLSSPIRTSHSLVYLWPLYQFTPIARDLCLPRLRLQFLDHLQIGDFQSRELTPPISFMMHILPKHWIPTLRGEKNVDEIILCVSMIVGLVAWYNLPLRQPSLESTHAPTSMLIKEHGPTMPPTPSFASTPAAFHLFPKSNNDAQRPCGPTLDSFSFGLAESYDLATLSNLRSNAFGELHRTVAESGEGLIQRMRDYELSRSKSDVHLGVANYPRRGRNKSPHGTLPEKTLSQRCQPDDGEDDDEVQILLPQMSSPGSSSRHKKRAVSLGPDDCPSPSIGSQRCFLPSSYPRSIYHSDDELHVPGVRSPSLAYSLLSSAHQLPPSSTPALSHTLSNSSNSSLVSLDLPPPIPSNMRHSPRPALASTRSEKAIAALTLAMANGAGGLTDYQTLLAIQTAPALDNSQVGEMWD